MLKIEDRKYQQDAIDMVLAWLEANAGNPCLVMPTGSGKSHVIAMFCKQTLTTWPETRVLMLTHVKELIEQNVEKMRQHWPGAPLGIYSAGLNKRQLGEPITFAGIQSIRKRASDVGHIDIVIVDECDLVGHNEVGGYRTFLAALLAINPQLRVIGLTATPYRLGHGYITDKPALFDERIEPVDVIELLGLGHVCQLRLKRTNHRYDTTGVAKRGGDYVESELQKVVDTEEQNKLVIDEVMQHNSGRRSWLMFCTGVAHAKNIAEEFKQRGVTTETVTGNTPKKERADILARFKRGEIQCLTNANVLTTGFDAPNVDLIGFLRPTASTRLMIQMAGRGMRNAEGKQDCIVLDFAGVSHVCGTIIEPKIPGKSGTGDGIGDAPVKVCETCNSICPISAKICPDCGTPFPIVKEDDNVTVDVTLVDGDIMGLSVDRDELRDMEVGSWRWRLAKSAKTGKEQIVLTYYGKALSDRAVHEYLCVLHDGYAGQKAWQTVAIIAQRCGPLPVGLLASEDVNALVGAMNAAIPPAWIQHTREGNFDRITKRHWV
jgi:DNA repair protein RadD